jgi:hypothetical protein
MRRTHIAMAVAFLCLFAAARASRPGSWNSDELLPFMDAQEYWGF